MVRHVYSVKDEVQCMDTPVELLLVCYFNYNKYPAICYSNYWCQKTSNSNNYGVEFIKTMIYGWNEVNKTGLHQLVV